MDHVSEFAQKAKKAAALTLPVVYSGVTAVTVYASETGTTTTLTDTTTTALTSAITAMADAVASAISSVIPIALPLVGCSVVVTVGLKIFKTILNKA